MIPGLPNGVTRRARVRHRYAEYIGVRSYTRGTEPSKYPKEKTSKEIP